MLCNFINILFLSNNTPACTQIKTCRITIYNLKVFLSICLKNKLIYYIVGQTCFVDYEVLSCSSCSAEQIGIHS
jgi:hypothetical protein